MQIETGVDLDADEIAVFVGAPVPVPTDPFVDGVGFRRFHVDRNLGTLHGEAFDELLLPFQEKGRVVFLCGLHVCPDRCPLHRARLALRIRKSHIVRHNRFVRAGV